MAINWDEVKKNNGNFKNYAQPGVYKVKCIDVDIREVGNNGSVVQEFIFEDSEDMKFPKATHWLTFKEGKAGWRQWHNRQLMVVLGVPEETAEKYIEKVESAGDKDKIVEAYTKAYKSILNKKKPSVEIEVFPDGEYSSSEFTDGRVAMPHDRVKPATTATEFVPEDIETDDGSDDTIDLSELPF